jgi:signal peptidase I
MKKILDNRVFKIITGIIRTIFILIIIAYLAFILIQRFSGNKSVFGYRLFTIATGSMSGVYEINDVIAVKDCDTNTLKVGDDIAYQGNKGGLEGMLITHRIVRIEDKEDGHRIFYTKGVNAPGEDPAVEESQILGKVVGVVPVISFINHIVKTQAGFFLLIFCPLVIIIVLEILQTITDYQLDKNKIKKIKSKEIFEEDDEEEDEEEED